MCGKKKKGPDRQSEGGLWWLRLQRGAISTAGAAVMLRLRSDVDLLTAGACLTRAAAQSRAPTSAAGHAANLPDANHRLAKWQMLI